MIEDNFFLPDETRSGRFGLADRLRHQTENTTDEVVTDESSLSEGFVDMSTCESGDEPDNGWLLWRHTTTYTVHLSRDDAKSICGKCLTERFVAQSRLKTDWVRCSRCFTHARAAEAGFPIEGNGAEHREAEPVVPE